MNIGQDIEKLIDQRIDLALKQRDEKIRALEIEKKQLTRLASELKNEVKNMKVTVAMYEKQINSSSKVFRRLAHKCVGCDIRLSNHDLKNDFNLDSSKLVSNNLSELNQNNINSNSTSQMGSIVNANIFENHSAVSKLNSTLTKSHLNGFNLLKKESNTDSYNNLSFSNQPSISTENDVNLDVVIIDLSEDEENSNR